MAAHVYYSGCCPTPLISVVCSHGHESHVRELYALPVFVDGLIELDSKLSIDTWQTYLNLQKCMVLVEVGGSRCSRALNGPQASVYSPSDNAERSLEQVVRMGRRGSLVLACNGAINHLRDAS